MIILRASEVVGEASARERNCHLGVDLRGTSNGCDEGTRSREVGLEARHVGAVIVLTVTSTDTVITAREHDATTANTKLSEQAADLNSIVEWNLDTTRLNQCHDPK